MRARPSRVSNKVRSLLSLGGRGSFLWSQRSTFSHGKLGKTWEHEGLSYTLGGCVEDKPGSECETCDGTTGLRDAFFDQHLRVRNAKLTLNFCDTNIAQPAISAESEETYCQHSTAYLDFNHQSLARQVPFQFEGDLRRLKVSPRSRASL